MSPEHDRRNAPFSKLSDQTEGCQSSFMHDLVSILANDMITALKLQKEVIEKKDQHRFMV